MVAIRRNWQNIRQYIWLIGGLLCFLFALIFWILTDTKDFVTVVNPIEEAQVQIQPEKVAATTHLGALMDEVRPLEMTTRVVAAGNHEPEFRGTKFFQENKKAWTVELFKASNEDIIRAFLRKQSDRKKFIYFRLSGENQTEQYVVAYGIFNNDAQAKAQIQQLSTILPTTLRPQTVQFEKYLTSVNDLGTEEMAGGSNKMYEVKLRSAPLPAIDETLIARTASSTGAEGPSETTTKTTITRRDASGNVVDVQKSQSSVVKKEPKASVPEKKAEEHTVTDPFN